jgi:hypothetical protein
MRFLSVVHTTSITLASSVVVHVMTSYSSRHHNHHVRLATTHRSISASARSPAAVASSSEQPKRMVEGGWRVVTTDEDKLRREGTGLPLHDSRTWWFFHNEITFYQLTRFNPGNAHAWGLLRHEELVGSSELDGDQTTQGNTGFTQVQPPCRVKTYVLLVWLLLMRWLTVVEYNGGEDAI